MPYGVDPLDFAIDLTGVSQAESTFRRQFSYLEIDAEAPVRLPEYDIAGIRVRGADDAYNDDCVCGASHLGAAHYHKNRQQGSSERTHRI